MNWIDSVVPWSTSRSNNKWYDIIRATLGVIIIYKGISFTFNSHELLSSLNFLLEEFTFVSNETNTQSIPELFELTESINFLLIALLLIYLLTAHLIGGALLVLGLYTRWMCLIQLPILLAAVFLINLPTATLSAANALEFALSIFTLFGLVYYFFKGSGALSIDQFRKRDMQLEDVLLFK